MRGEMIRRDLRLGRPSTRSRRSAGPPPETLRTQPHVARASTHAPERERPSREARAFTLNWSASRFRDRFLKERTGGGLTTCLFRDPETPRPDVETRRGVTRVFMMSAGTETGRRNRAVHHSRPCSSTAPLPNAARSSPTHASSSLSETNTRSIGCFSGRWSVSG